MADMLTRIGNLLRKAEGTDSEAERNALIEKAQELATRHSINMAIAREHTASKERSETPIVKRIVIGERGKVGLATYCELFMAIGRVNNVQFDIAQNSTCVWAYGFAGDIDLTEQIYAVVVPQMILESEAFIRSGVYKQERVWRIGTVRDGEYRYRDWGWFPVHGRSARLHFQQAFAGRVARRLRDAKHNVVKEAAKSPGSGAELALRATEVAVTDFYQQQSNAKGHWRGGTVSDGGSMSREAGDTAGSRARLGTETPIGGSRKQVTA